jgi:uncharacterized membrane protein
MFLFTASAHWGKRRRDLIAMVPRIFPRPELMVSATGAFEILGGLGLLIPAVAPVAAACLAMLLIGLFPANISAAREHLTIGGRPATPLPLSRKTEVRSRIAAIDLRQQWDGIKRDGHASPARGQRPIVG